MKKVNELQERIEVLLHEMQHGNRKTMIDEIQNEAENAESFCDMYELSVMDDNQLRNAISGAIKLRVQEIIEELTKIDSQPF